MRRAIGVTARLLLAVFFVFVGGNKAFASRELLVEHHAWTVYLPSLAGRLVGWSEVACAAALVLSLLPRWSRLGLATASVLVGNQAAAIFVHLTHDEGEALPQNAVLMAASLLVIWAVRTRPVEIATGRPHRSRR